MWIYYKREQKWTATPMRDSEKTKLSFIGVVFMPRKQKLSAEEKVRLVPAQKLQGKSENFQSVQYNTFYKNSTI